MGVRTSFGDGVLEVLLTEFKAGLNAYLADLGPKAPVRTLKEVIEFNEPHSKQEMSYFGQDLFAKAEEKGPLTCGCEATQNESCPVLA